MKHPVMTVEEKVAQLFMVGSDTPVLEEELEPFYRYGLGGLLLFRHHFQPFSTAFDVRDFLTQFKARFQGLGISFIGIDQEGGQVERLPHWLFTTGILPVVFGLKQDVLFCEQVNRETARRLRWIGLTLNFTPTVDLDREMMNPIIGVRAYGNNPDTVLPFARVVMNAHRDAGVLPVAKHFPGHGSGTVDSHLDLPTFNTWQEDELRPYEALIREGLPGILVAHGLYPHLAKTLGTDVKVPASLSEAMVTGLLRQKLGFDGLVFTDDLTMGAVWKDRDPMEVAIQALEAGADMLVYRRAKPEAIQAFEILVRRVQQGRFPESLLDEKLHRILQYREKMAQVPVYDYPEIAFSAEACQTQSLQWAQIGLTELHHQFISPLPLSHQSRWGLVAPDRKTMRHYGPDMQQGKDLLGWCQEYGLFPSVHQYYPIEGSHADFEPVYWAEETLEAIVFVAFNSHLNPLQQQLYEKLKTQHPEAKMILVSCGMPTDGEVLARPWIHVQLPSFRPAAMQALVQWLITSPKLSSSVVPGLSQNR